MAVMIHLLEKGHQSNISWIFCDNFLRSRYQSKTCTQPNIYCIFNFSQYSGVRMSAENFFSSISIVKNLH